MSAGIAREVNARRRGVEKSGGLPTEEKREGHLNHREILFAMGKTYLIRIQWDRRQIHR